MENNQENGKPVDHGGDDPDPLRSSSGSSSGSGNRTAATVTAGTKSISTTTTTTALDPLLCTPQQWSSWLVSVRFAGNVLAAQDFVRQAADRLLVALTSDCHSHGVKNELQDLSETHAQSETATRRMNDNSNSVSTTASTTALVPMSPSSPPPPDAMMLKEQPAMERGMLLWESNTGANAVDGIELSFVTPRVKLRLAACYQQGWLLQDKKMQDSMWIPAASCDQLIVFPKPEDVTAAAKVVNSHNRNKSIKTGSSNSNTKSITYFALLVFRPTKATVPAVTFKNKPMHQLCWQFPAELPPHLVATDDTSAAFTTTTASAVCNMESNNNNNGISNNHHRRNHRKFDNRPVVEAWIDFVYQSLGAARGAGLMQQQQQQHPVPPHTLHVIRIFHERRSNNNGSIGTSESSQYTDCFASHQDTGTSTTTGGLPFVTCHHHVHAGIIFPIHDGLLFWKPPLWIPRQKMHSISCGRGSSDQVMNNGSRYIDLVVELNNDHDHDDDDTSKESKTAKKTMTTTTIEFSNIHRSEQTVFMRYINHVLIPAMQRDIQGGGVDGNNDDDDDLVITAASNNHDSSSNMDDTDEHDVVESIQQQPHDSEGTGRRSRRQSQRGTAIEMRQRHMTLLNGTRTKITGQDDRNDDDDDDDEEDDENDPDYVSPVEEDNGDVDESTDEDDKDDDDENDDDDDDDDKDHDAMEAHLMDDDDDNDDEELDVQATVIASDGDNDDGDNYNTCYSANDDFDLNESYDPNRDAPPRKRPKSS